MTRRQAAVPWEGAASHLREGGFALVEAVVSLAVLGILLALAFSGRSLIDNRRLAGAARTLGTEVRWVEQRARAERRCWRIQFLPATERYQLQYLVGGTWTAGGGCSGGTWTDYVPVPGRSLPARIDLVSTTFGGNVVTVSPYGNPTAVGEVVLATPAGERRRVTINAGGKVTIIR